MKKKRDVSIFGNIVLGAVTLPRGCTRRLTLSVQLNVYVPSAILSLVAPHTSKLTPPFLRRKIPRGVHSIIRYLCRGDHVAHNRRKKKVSIEQENSPCVVSASFKLSGPHLSLSLVRNRSFAPPRPRIDH